MNWKHDMRRLQLTAMLFLMMVTTVLTSCTSDNDDNSSGKTTLDSAIVGNWTADISGRTFSLWTSGPALSMITFNADGTGAFDTYYTLVDEPIARDNQTFTYTTTSDGHLTMEMEDGTFTYTYKLVDGKMKLNYEGSEVTYDRPSDAEQAKFDEWGKQKDLVDVPIPARYTVFVYGNAGGNMDYIIEKGFWERIKDLLTDSTNVRVVCFYKYGKDTSSEYDDDGDIVWFELNSKTDLDKIREAGLSGMGFAEQAKNMKLCDPASLQMFMEFSSLECPAQEYIFSIWGHGSGFDPMGDVPGKYDESRTSTRGVIGDEWNEEEQLDMYELSQAIKESGAVGRVNTIFFHNCLMGNIETLTELRDVTNYICCSSHVLYSDGIVLREFVKGLMEKGNTEDAVAQMFKEIRPAWDNQYIEDGGYPNGDFKMLRTSKFGDLLDACKKLATRVVELYPTQKEAIGRATNSVYRFHEPVDRTQNFCVPFFDLADYAHKLAAETGDDKLTAISTEIDNAFSNLIVHYADVNWSEQHLDHYSLSVCIYDKFFYNYDFIGEGNAVKANIYQGYEQCSFHQLTGWGNFLRINETSPWGNPYCGGGGALKKD